MLTTLERTYIEALFFTEEDPGHDTPAWLAADPETREGSIPYDAELSPEAVARVTADCAAFAASDAYRDYIIEYGPDDRQAGHDLWLTRNGHGAGFWDGDWPEDFGDRLTAAAKALGECWAYVGDDGLVYLT